MYYMLFLWADIRSCAATVGWLYHEILFPIVIEAAGDSKIGLYLSSLCWSSNSTRVSVRRKSMACRDASHFICKPQKRRHMGGKQTSVSKNTSLQWRHNGRDSVSNHQHHDCLLNRLFRRRSKKTSKLRVTGLCAGNSPGTGEFPTQMASYAENVSIWWRHHDQGSPFVMALIPSLVVIINTLALNRKGCHTAEGNTNIIRVKTPQSRPLRYQFRVLYTIWQYWSRSRVHAELC